MSFLKNTPLGKLQPQKQKAQSGARTVKYDIHGKVIRQGLSRKAKIIITCSIVSVLLLGTLGVVYLPQYFITANVAGEPIARTNAAAWDEMQTHLRQSGNADYDGDGLTNDLELSVGSDPFFADTDLDGVMDYNDQNPTSADKTLQKAIKNLGKDINTPYAINGVILWPDDNASWTHGAVINNQTGYQFSRFKGWAKFPEDGIAYKYEDGRHTSLPYKKEVGAYYIDGDCKVVLSVNEKEMTYRISFFNNETYMRNGLGKFLANILPDSGWITGQAMWLDDTFIDTGRTKEVKYTPVDISEVDDTRYALYTNDLDDLAAVYGLIDDGYYVMASLMSEEYGEMIVEVYGYTDAGDLLVANPENGSQKGILSVSARCVRCLNDDNKVSLFNYFSFAGCGYDADRDARIAFFSANKAEE